MNTTSDTPFDRREQAGRRSNEERRQQDDPTFAGPEQRLSVVDRRTGADRRKFPKAGQTGFEQIRGPGRRRTQFTKDAEEGEMSHEQFMFVMAINAFKKVRNRPFPSWTEILEVIRKLGYRKTAPCEVNLPNVEDWQEDPQAPAITEAETEAELDER